jgi:hypothetical protein
MSKFKNQIVLSLVLATMISPADALANPVAFAKGDSSIVGVVNLRSNFMKDGVEIDAATLFCCAQALDYTKGIQLDVSRAPAAQLAAVRGIIDKLLMIPKTKQSFCA